jgi:hypothetical protein
VVDVVDEDRAVVDDVLIVLRPAGGGGRERRAACADDEGCDGDETEERPRCYSLPTTGCRWRRRT